MKNRSMLRRSVLCAIANIPLALSGYAFAKSNAAPAEAARLLNDPAQFQGATFNEAVIIHLLENMAADKEDATAIRKIMQGSLPRKDNVSIISISLKTAEAIRVIDREYPSDTFMSPWHDVPAQNEQKKDAIPHGVFVQVKNGTVSVDVAQVSFRNFSGMSLPTASMTNDTMPFKGAVLIAIDRPEDDDTPGFIALGNQNRSSGVQEWILVVPKDARAQ